MRSAANPGLQPVEVVLVEALEGVGAGHLDADAVVDFFDLFGDFTGNVDFFLLQDLVIDDFTAVRFFMPSTTSRRRRSLRSPYRRHMNQTVTPTELARELGVSAKSIRQWLRVQGWQSSPYARWRLSADQAAQVRKHFAA